MKDTDDFEREKYFTSIAVEGARIGVIKAKRAKLPLLRPDGMIYNFYKNFPPNAFQISLLKW